ncbi:MAG: hypothetical protein WAN66_03945 [Limnoraphis robusta]|uniref:hypothetical protein n=1 Tax=Limnoraphis robusta TaxID=1118279 RepID=UPI002B202D1F|nr:hypothetical protein [Limnoraphis robusta]MEA5499029.1 hypothetical protein [Limnoraphis robusta BA-68 BA1]MEA5539368.1 hypothetical protein [Limnoraphis robusta Tam1]
MEKNRKFAIVVTGLLLTISIVQEPALAGSGGRILGEIWDSGRKTVDDWIQTRPSNPNRDNPRLRNKVDDDGIQTTPSNSNRDNRRRNQAERHIEACIEGGTAGLEEEGYQQEDIHLGTFSPSGMTRHGCREVTERVY